jgi:pyridinium-3,5-biscarboxylic acid mononucleotide synthase
VSKRNRSGIVDRDTLKKMLEAVRSGRLSVADAGERLRHLPIDELGFATLDTHRALRRGFPETIYGPGKSPEQIVAIVTRLHTVRQTALVTRVGPDVHAAVAARHPNAEYHTEARAVVLRAGAKRKGRPGVVVMTAGTTDIGVAEEATLTAELMGEQVRRIYDVGVAGLHRLLSHRKTLTTANVIVAVAGMEGALPSVVAGLVECPVIAVPTSVGYGAGTGGFAALFAMLNSCAPGVSVVNIDNGHGAGCLASLINRRSKSAKNLA